MNDVPQVEISLGFRLVVSFFLVALDALVPLVSLDEFRRVRR